MGQLIDLVQNTASFTEFYSCYPRRQARQDAEKAWGKLSSEEKLLALKTLPDHIRVWAEEERARQFIPLPASWLNGKRFEDELDISLPQVKTCRWTGCNGSAKHQHGRASYCEKHIVNVKRGETPVGR